MRMMHTKYIMRPKLHLNSEYDYNQYNGNGVTVDSYLKRKR